MLKIKTSYDEDTRIWYGVKSDSKCDKKSSIGKMILHMLRTYPEHIAQICVDSDRKYMNSEIADLSVSIAKHFMKLPLEQCDVVGICLFNTELLAPLCYGAIYAGFILSPTDPRCDQNHMEHIYSISKPKVLFCDGIDYSRLKEVITKCNLNTSIYTIKNHVDGVPTIEEFLSEKDSRDFEVPPLKHGVTQTLAVLPTAGTTGLVKCVSLTHEGYMTNLKEILQGEVLLNFSTIFWGSGFTFLVCPPLSNHTRVITEKPFSPQTLFQIMEKYKPTFMFVPPSSLGLALTSPEIKNCDWSNLKLCFIGGSTLHSVIIEKIKEFATTTEFLNGYSLTEANGSGIAIGPARTDGGIGPIMENVEVKIIDDDGNSLGPNEVGEICGRFPIYWPGYYNDPKATAAVLESERWLHTGDLGYVNKEGILFLSNRKKELLKYNSFHFTPTELERVIHGLDDVIEVCAGGIPDLISGYLPMAAVVLKEGSDLTAENISEYVASRAADHMKLRGGVYIMDFLPKSLAGKLLRREVVSLCEKLRKDKALPNYEFLD